MWRAVHRRSIWTNWRWVKWASGSRKEFSVSDYNASGVSVGFGVSDSQLFECAGWPSLAPEEDAEHLH